MTDDHLPPDASPAMASARPWVAVNVPGTGRGATSQWWGLFGVGAAGALQSTSPLGQAIAAYTGVAPPGMLDLVAAAGAHTARVAGPAEPLVAPGACKGTARFAFVLTGPDGGKTAWTFGVPCDVSPTAPGTGQALPPDAAGPDFLAALQLAESGNPSGAATAWDRALGLADGARLGQWFASLDPDPAADPKEVWVNRRPAVGDVLIWTADALGADGTPLGPGTTVWWHDGPSGGVELARRPGIWIVDGPGLLREIRSNAPLTAPAGGGCKALTGTRTGLALRDDAGATRS